MLIVGWKPSGRVDDRTTDWSDPRVRRLDGWTTRWSGARILGCGDICFLRCLDCLNGNYYYYYYFLFIMIVEFADILNQLKVNL